MYDVKTLTLSADAGCNDRRKLCYWANHDHQMWVSGLWTLIKQMSIYWVSDKPRFYVGSWVRSINQGLSDSSWGPQYVGHTLSYWQVSQQLRDSWRQLRVLWVISPMSLRTGHYLQVGVSRNLECPRTDHTVVFICHVYILTWPYLLSLYRTKRFPCTSLKQPNIDFWGSWAWVN